MLIQISDETVVSFDEIMRIGIDRKKLSLDVYFKDGTNLFTEYATKADFTRAIKNIRKTNRIAMGVPDENE